MKNKGYAIFFFFFFFFFAGGGGGGGVQIRCIVGDVQMANG